MMTLVDYQIAQYEAKQSMKMLVYYGFTSVILTTIISIVLLIFFFVGQADAQIIKPASYTVEELADAIYFAEGGESAKKPYGILSVYCATNEECRRVALNTINNNAKRYVKYGHKKFDTYLEFLASRYAPVGAENDPQGLNKNWLKNVKYFLANKKEVEHGL